ncbi:MAG TPA: TRAP transporter small permease [Dongiaceae bacterium]|nr:TRAP transporter small permease [Dongiaceae bacterium]
MKRAINWLGTQTAHLGLWIAAAALLIIVALNGLNIVLRYFFFAALSWAEEAMLYLMILGVYAGAVSVAWQQAHIRIDAFLNMAPPRYRRMLNLVSTLILAAILIPVTLASYHVTSMLFDFDQRSDAMHLPMWIPQGVVPAAMLLIIVMSLLRIFVHPEDPDGDPQNLHGAG